MVSFRRIRAMRRAFEFSACLDLQPGRTSAIKVLLRRCAFPWCFVFLQFRLLARPSRLTMVHLALLSTAAFLLSVACAKPLATTGRDMVVHERRDSVPSGFVHVGAAPEDEVLSLKFALTQSNFPGLESELYAISTPGSERYRQFLSKEQVSLLFSSYYARPRTSTHFMCMTLGRSFCRPIHRHCILLQRLARLQQPHLHTLLTRRRLGLRQHDRLTS